MSGYPPALVLDVPRSGCGSSIAGGYVWSCAFPLHLHIPWGASCISAMSSTLSVGNVHDLHGFCAVNALTEFRKSASWASRCSLLLLIANWGKWLDNSPPFADVCRFYLRGLIPWSSLIALLWSQRCLDRHESFSKYGNCVCSCICAKLSLKPLESSSIACKFWPCMLVANVEWEVNTNVRETICSL